MSTKKLVKVELSSLQLEELTLPVAFNHIDVDVDVPGGPKKRLLHNVTGQARAGRVLAIMGATGSGKTTLLNVLGGRLPTSGGTLTFGQYQWSKSLKRHIGFVEQDDVVVPALTVRESLAFSARLRLSSTMTRAQKMDRVNEVISLLRLDGCADTQVGDASQRGVSGGERKRLSIAGELLTRPSVLLLDEPTSGLDSTIALLVVQSISSLAKERHITVATSIHQPNSQIFSEMSDLLLVDKGKVAYFGEANKATEFFNTIGYPCPAAFNPPDFLMDLVVLEKLDQTAVDAIEQRFQLPRPEKKGEEEEEEEDRLVVKNTASTRYAVSYSEQVKILAERVYRVNKGHVFDSNQFILNVGLALLTGLLWFRLGSDESDVFLTTAASAWIIGTWMFFPLFGSLPVFPSEEVLLKKELSVGAYRLSAWFIARTATQYVLDSIWPTLWVPVVHYMTGINDDFGVFVLCYLIVLLHIAAVQAVGLAISAAVPGHRAMTVAMLIVAFFFGYAGLLNPDIWSWLEWTEYINEMLYAYQLHQYVVFGGQRYRCAEASEFSVCADGADFITDKDLEDVLINKPIWLCVVALVVISVVGRVIAYRFLRHKLLATDKLITV